MSRLITVVTLTNFFTNGAKKVRHVVSFNGNALQNINRLIAMFETSGHRKAVALPVAAALRSAAASVTSRSANRSLREAAWAYTNVATAETDLDARIALARARRLVG
jgi:hypothetical protein